ncbi:hypothetical protein RF679_09320 [Undibacterium cyanobacteriorum]|uniref:Uncharacterized protein n=1 Tax=Undibacterium cyanobacteriorum TaxID=3073561 RepID=A0ABY9RNV5_9BURK|nr:hypothetical protein [Undibacterium sp. 20NA77.5]WMW82459.1 hypothetical protein RF679_09320 [Undibacterium sp. 20NA77.5]
MQSLSRINRRLLPASLVATILLLTACATNGGSKNEPNGKVPTPINGNQSSIDNRVGDAIATPFSDLNLVRTEVPPILQQARRSAYAKPEVLDCEKLSKEIHDLDAVLGPDLDSVRVDGKGNVVDKGAEELGNATVGALKSFTSGIIPFRSWIRRLSGADRHEREVGAAGVAGIVRRAYLKGLAQASNCQIQPMRVQAESSTESPKNTETDGARK